jgi:N-methylhydantoinase B/oxoprolinase/acetone carboxylase alpha subunit
MKNYKYTFLYFEIKIDNPKYRIKSNGSNISQIVENIKLNIRNKYKNKINNYIHDIIIHIADNIIQSKEIQTLIKTFDKNIVNEFINLKYLVKIKL